MKKFLLTIGHAIKAAFGSISKLLRSNPQLFDKAFGLVKRLAELTPTRADDEIIAVCEQFGLSQSVQLYLAHPLEKRGMVLLDIAVTLLSKQFPDVASRFMVRVVSDAYLEFREVGSSQ